MSRLFSKIIPKTPLEQERFYLDTVDKLQDTDTTLADEDKKSSIPVIGMIHGLGRDIQALQRDMRVNRLTIDIIERQARENVLLKSYITRLEARITDIERQL